MTVRQLYDKVGGDYENTLARFLTEERMVRFALKFPADQSYALLKNSLESGDMKEAFRGAHTLKGVCQNLGFTALYEPAHRVTEDLRAGNQVKEEDLRELEERYKELLDALRAFGESNA